MAIQFKESNLVVSGYEYGYRLCKIWISIGLRDTMNVNDVTRTFHQHWTLIA